MGVRWLFRNLGDKKLVDDKIEDVLLIGEKVFGLVIEGLCF